METPLKETYQVHILKIGEMPEVPAHETYRIAAAVGVMTRIQAKTDQVGVRCFQEPLDLILVLDVGLRVRVIDGLYAEFLT